MEIARTIEEMRRWRKAGAGVVGLVPTMGALHEGHVSLVRAARGSCERVAASIFVNPAQFGPNEDFARYPRTFEADCAQLEREGVEVVFAPAAEEIYPAGAETWVEVTELGERLDGASRPGHFRGVATVVAKLFHIVQPDRAFFGQKDAVQVAVLKKMVSDLMFDVEIVVCPIVREADGLAMSSRNQYLSAEERARALVLSRALECVQRWVAAGERDSRALQERMLEELQGVEVDYAEIVDRGTLTPVTEVSKGALVAVAAWVGTTRLIDNLVLEAMR